MALGVGSTLSLTGGFDGVLRFVPDGYRTLHLNRSRGSPPLDVHLRAMPASVRGLFLHGDLRDDGVGVPLSDGLTGLVTLMLDGTRDPVTVLRGAPTTLRFLAIIAATWTRREPGAPIDLVRASLHLGDVLSRFPALETLAITCGHLRLGAVPSSLRGLRLHCMTVKRTGGFSAQVDLSDASGLRELRIDRCCTFDAEELTLPAGIQTWSINGDFGGTITKAET